MHWRQISILGVGLLGGSIGLAVRSAIGNCKLVGWGHRIESLRRAEEIGAIDSFHTDVASAVTGSDLVVLCTPVGTFEDILKQIAPALNADCLVTDVGSTKRSVVKAAEKWLGPQANFVASHPIAGSDKRGVEFARADLFTNALCILTPASRTPPHAVHQIESFWKMLGMRIIHLSPEEHDQRLADISHLPHVLAAALVAMQDDSALQLAGTGFLDTTRIAGGDGGLWKDILLDNADNLGDSLKRLREQINHVMHLLEKQDQKTLQTWLATAADRRAQLLERKLREMKSE
jgi:prephenate dehydrogenase